VQKQDKGCRMQSKVVTYIKFATKDETKKPLHHEQNIMDPSQF
jgi:hypothetical protein